MFNFSKVIGFLLTILLVSFFSTCKFIPPPEDPDPPPSWQLVWSDEFNGSSLDSNKWNILEGLFGSYTQLWLSSQVSVSDGCLKIKSDRGYFEIGDITGDYISGFVHTKGIFVQTYGRFEVRAKLPTGKGMWPAHWLLEDNIEPGKVGPFEIDIIECLGHDPNTIYMTNHYEDEYGIHRSNGGTYTGPDYSQDFHVFAIEWEPSEIRWYIDGILRFVSNVSVPQEDLFFILDTQVGGDWLGNNPDETTVFPQYHLIDYVRIYQMSE